MLKEYFEKEAMVSRGGAFILIGSGMILGAAITIFFGLLVAFLLLGLDLFGVYYLLAKMKIRIKSGPWRSDRDAKDEDEKEPEEIGGMGD